MFNDLQQISIPLKIGIHMRRDDHYLHGNITHLTTEMDAPIVGSGKGKDLDKSVPLLYHTTLSNNKKNCLHEESSGTQ